MECKKILQCKSHVGMKAPIQKLILELKAVVFGKDELEFRDMSELKRTFATSGQSGFQFRRKDQS